MALTAAAQMCSGVGKSGSRRLKSKTVLPWDRSCRASAPAASVADGCTSAAMREMVTAFSPLDIPYLLELCPWSVVHCKDFLTTDHGPRTTDNCMTAPEGNRGERPLRVAHFVQRYPPALGG